MWLLVVSNRAIRQFPKNPWTVVIPGRVIHHRFDLPESIWKREFILKWAIIIYNFIIKSCYINCGSKMISIKTERFDSEYGKLMKNYISSCFRRTKPYQLRDANCSPMAPSAFHQEWKFFRAKPVVTRHGASIWQSRAKNRPNVVTFYERAILHTYSLVEYFGFGARLIMTKCNMIMLTCHLFMFICNIIMLTCLHAFMSTYEKHMLI